jgi:putative phosphoesterase
LKPLHIAVISDTHDRLPGHVCAAIADADEIWHLGDVCMPAILDTLKILGPTLRVVRGNCDDYSAWPLTLDFDLAGHRFHLEHIPSRTAPTGAEFFLHGHTHVPRDETLDGVRFLNPGCITRPNRGAPASYAWLRLGENKAVEWELVRV